MPIHIFCLNGIVNMHIHVNVVAYINNEMHAIFIMKLKTTVTVCYDTHD